MPRGDRPRPQRAHAAGVGPASTSPGSILAGMQDAVSSREHGGSSPPCWTRCCRRWRVSTPTASRPFLPRYAVHDALAGRGVRVHDAASIMGGAGARHRRGRRAAGAHGRWTRAPRARRRERARMSDLGVRPRQHAREMRRHGCRWPASEPAAIAHDDAAGDLRYRGRVACVASVASEGADVALLDALSTVSRGSICRVHQPRLGRCASPIPVPPTWRGSLPRPARCLRLRTGAGGGRRHRADHRRAGCRWRPSRRPHRALATS